ncbi:MAG: hypothetical protein HRT86_15015 [Ilumatobacteraceae bacterium]|nr:hypothetical protein [Ilumatobacteraceae bacterium]
MGARRRTNGAADNGTLANFWLDDDGTPHVATRHFRNGCLTLTPNRLDEVRPGQTRTLAQQRDTSDCRNEAPDVDVNNNGEPDELEELYRVSDDGPRLYVERNVVAAEAQLGVSDWDADADGYSAYARTNGSGEYGAFIDLTITDGVPTLRVEHPRKRCQILKPNRTDTVGTSQTRRMVVVDRPGGTCQT